MAYSIIHISVHALQMWQMADPINLWCIIHIIGLMWLVQMVVVDMQCMQE
jgi:hypothetical protein